METKVPRPRGRPRKHKRPEDEKVSTDVKRNVQGKRQVKERRLTGTVALVGRYVLKEFKGNGVFIGKIVSYDSGLYRVEYEDGDCEDLDSVELREIVLGDNDFNNDMNSRKKRLDEHIKKRSLRKNDTRMKDVDLHIQVNSVEASTLIESSGGLTETVYNGETQVEVEGDTDSSSDSCEHAHDRNIGFEVETLLAPPPQLPQSSGNIGVPEDFVSHLFSVYGFLRSFSIQLFLYPFGLDDFVGALNCRAPNSLLDAIHVALMQVLQRHLESLASDGSTLASNCLRCVDWNLLDSLTWPVYLILYFTVRGYLKGSEWKGFYDSVMEKEYYSLSAGLKLMTMQILCDDVLDSVELRAEMDSREELEVGVDPGAVTTNPLGNGPRRVHPRYSKTSACKDRNTTEIVPEKPGMISFGKIEDLSFKGTVNDTSTTGADLDANCDECRLCGMDGTLLCCDGCPSAYHSRCIGVIKMHIPGGSWYCPECTINKMRPTIMVGTLLKGAEVFGVDQYEQIFLGTCDHLLVFNTSINAKPNLRYYNMNDIPIVVKVLLCSRQHTASYSGICKGIMQYWNISESVFSLVKATEIGPYVANIKKDEPGSTVLPLLCKESHEAPSTIEAEAETENMNSFVGSHVDKVAGSCLDTIMATTTGINLPVIEGPHALSSVNKTLHVQIKTESAMSNGSVSQLDDLFDLTNQSLIERSSAIDIATCLSGNNNDRFGGNANGSSSLASMRSQSKTDNLAESLRGNTKSTNNYTYQGSCFKPQAYINHYTNGDLAASAAANLDTFTSEETYVSEANKSGNARKASSSNIFLQVKAFSSAASRFFWPSIEKKDIARERCGWCHSCQSPPSSRRGCMLNAAVTSATRNAAKTFSGLFPLKRGEGSYSSITAYILYMEESLRGFVAGPFLSENHRKSWRKQVEKALTCTELKSLVLELGENICTIALSKNWVKLMDDWLVESFIIPSVSCTVETTQKRGPGGKRQRKQSEVKVDVSCDNNISWWRGGKLSNQILQNAILPCSMIRKAACQGGVRKISGFSYTDGAEIPKRSKQLIWKAAVERTKNASQLALQIRYLDFHVRWSDLVRPEQNLLDGKGPEIEASIFRNAHILDKKIVDKKIRYGVDFGNQKHLPSRVMKNVVGVEQTQNGKDKYWFLETRIPLYLIKEFEEKTHNVCMPSVQRPMNKLSQLQRKQLKVSRRNIFSYLISKRDKSEKCFCASCQMDVIVRDSVTCNTCQGYCHEDCALSSNSTNGKVELLITCKRCYQAKALYEINRKHITTTPLPLGRQQTHVSITATKGKGTQLKASNQSFTPIRLQETSSMIKQAASDSSLMTKSRSKIRSWGVICRKKNIADTGIDFRRSHILLSGGSGNQSLKPVCNTCLRPYNPKLMYIHCETCEKWYHAEALELEESKVSEVVGFKCCKCRRIGGPDCPYMDPKLREEKRQKRELRIQKRQGESGVDSDRFEPRDSKPTTSVVPPVCAQDNDPLLFSLSRVEQISENNADLEWNNGLGPGLQKLPVRRHGQREGDAAGLSESNTSLPELPSCQETNSTIKSEEEQSFPVDCLDVYNLEGEVMIDTESLSYEDMEFEPQTYFSFNELLASEEGGQCEGFDLLGDLLGDTENQSSSMSYNGTAEQFGLETSDHLPESTISVKLESNVVPCERCSHSDPAANLCCQVCGLTIHSHCSPWEELSPSEGSWKCGRCREWR